MKPPIPLAIIHRNRIFQECLAAELCRDRERFSAVATDHDHAATLAAIVKERPAVVLVDLNLPGRAALEWTHQIHDQAESTKVVLLTHSGCEEDLVDCFEAGAQGCVLEESSLEELRGAIETVASGETYCSPKLVHSMFGCLARSAREAYRRERSRACDLTPRELEVLQLIEQDLSNKQIARRLSLSLFTVKNHVHNIVEKLKVSDRYEAVEFARRRRWLTRLKF